jgi:hypothetical protein
MTIVGIAPQGFTGRPVLLSREIYLPIGMYHHFFHGETCDGTLHHATLTPFFWKDGSNRAWQLPMPMPSLKCHPRSWLRVTQLSTRAMNKNAWECLDTHRFAELRRNWPRVIMQVRNLSDAAKAKNHFQAKTRLLLKSRWDIAPWAK